MRKILLLVVCFLFLVALYGNASAELSCPSGLAHYWKFDEGIGSIAYDSVGNIDGTIVGPQWTTGKVGGALDFDGTFASVNLGDVAAVEGTSLLTIQAWVQFFSLNNWDIIVLKQESGTSSLGMHLAATDFPPGVDDVNVVISNGSSAWGYTNNDLLAGNVGSWHLMTMVFDGTQTGNANRLKFYFDGVGQTLTYVGTIPNLTADNIANMTIGLNFNIAPDAIIDEVAIFSTALAATEIQQHYQNGLHGKGYCEEIMAISCVGFESPMASGPVTVKKNRVLPLKAQLLNTESNNVTDSDIAAPVLQVLYNSGTGGDPVDVTDVALHAGEGTDGNQFVFTDDLKWQFNLKTKNYAAQGTYTISMVTGDGSEYRIDPMCEAKFVIK
jgi:hypothetical protein